MLYPGFACGGWFAVAAELDLLRDINWLAFGIPKQ